MEFFWFLDGWEALSLNRWYAVAKLRCAVFVVEQNCPYQDFDGKDQRSHHLWAEDQKGEVHACLRIVAPGVSYEEVSIGRVATSADTRGTGMGKVLMQRGMQAVIQLYGDVPVRISAQHYLVRFYEAFGFKTVGEPYLEDDIPHIEMLYTP
ncbi:MAG: GNAT family N-acetyltransferase [Flavobacteriales bacterium]